MIYMTSNRSLIDKYRVRMADFQEDANQFGSVLEHVLAETDLSHKDLSHVARVTYYLFHKSEGFWANIREQILSRVEERSRPPRQSHVPYLYQAALYYILAKGESDAQILSIFDNFMDQEFDRLSILAKANILELLLLK